MTIEITVDELYYLAKKIQVVPRYAPLTGAEEATAEVLNKIKIKEEEARHASETGNSI